MSALVELKCCACDLVRQVFRSQIGTRYVFKEDEYRCRPCFQQARRDGVVPPGRAKTGRVVACVSCGKTKPATKREVETAGKYHCRDCYLKLRAAGALPQGVGRKVSVVCPDCGLIRQVKPSQAKRLSGLCGSCARKGARGGSWAGGPVTLTCTDCGHQQKYRPGAARTMTVPYRCNRCCKPSGPANHAWRGGTSFAPYPLGWTPALRRAIRRRDHNTCVLCGFQGNAHSLDVHHIDYDKNNLTRPNLITLCRTCHTKTNFNRSYWLALLVQKVAT